MQRQKKQLLGLFGLGLAAVMVLSAGAMPAPEAAAVDSSKVGLTVRVANAGTMPEVDILTLENQDVVVYRKFKVKISYLKATKLQVFLKLDGLNSVSRAAGDEIELDVDGQCDITYSEDPQTCELEYTLDAELTPETQSWNYTTRAVASNELGQVGNDAVTFKYQSAHVVYDGSSDASGNPIADILVNDKVTKFILQATGVSSGNKVFVSGDKDGIVVTKNADGVFVDESGLPVAIAVSNADGVVKVSMPFKELGAESGNYAITLVAYEGDQVIAMDTSVKTVQYTSGSGTHQPGRPSDPSTPDNPNNPDDPNNPGKPSDPNNPEVPDTGSSLFKDLNITRADYVVTGLVAFGMVTAFAIFLMVRRNRR